MAAAFFNADPPRGWRAVSAGLTPQSEVSVRLLPMLAETGARAFADTSNPRAFKAGEGDRVVALDVELDDAETWTTDGEDEAVRDQIRDRVKQLRRELAATASDG